MTQRNVQSVRHQIKINGYWYIFYMSFLTSLIRNEWWTETYFTYATFCKYWMLAHLSIVWSDLKNCQLDVLDCKYVKVSRLILDCRQLTTYTALIDVVQCSTVYK